MSNSVSWADAHGSILKIAYGRNNKIDFRSFIRYLPELEYLTLHDEQITRTPKPMNGESRVQHDYFRVD